MRHVIIYISKILAILGLSLFILSQAYDYVFLNSTPRSKTSFILKNKNLDFDYIFLGSSRVDNFIDPDKFKEVSGKTVLNLGLQGGKIGDYYLTLQLLKNQNIKADSIFIQMDYVYNFDDTSNMAQSELMPYRKITYIKEFFKSRRTDSWFILHMPFYGYLINDYKKGFREFIAALINKQPRIDPTSGFNPLYGNPYESIAGKLPARLIKENNLIHKMQEAARRNNSTVVFFVSPMCAQVTNRDFFKKLKKRLPSIKDYSNLLPDDSYFYDCSHVNNKGAQLFSEILAKDLRDNTFTPILK